jgi:hypothetical protein
MTRTVEEVAEALFDLHGWNGPSDNDGGVRNTILAALREARDAALHEAVMSVSSRRGGGTIEHMERRAAVEAIRSLASSPPPAAPARDHFTTVAAVAAALPVDPEADARVDALFARQPKPAPARDDRGAEQDPGPCADHAPYIGCVRCAPTATKPCTGPDTGASEEYEEQMFARAASSSGEATALREALDLIRDIETAIYWNDDPAKGMVSGWWSGNPDTAALHARMLRALAAPSQETETRCEHPAAAVTEYRDGHKRCSACAALWYGDENGGWRSEGKEAPAPAPSAATDTGKDGSR